MHYNLNNITGALRNKNISCVANVLPDIQTSFFFIATVHILCLKLVKVITYVSQSFRWLCTLKPGKIALDIDRDHLEWVQNMYL